MKIKAGTGELLGMGNIVILGWGSLIWDPTEKWGKTVKKTWHDDGPYLPLEFSRVSGKRNGALTLVIDPRNGKQCRTKYVYSRRVNLDTAVMDLARREKCSVDNIGYVDLDFGFSFARRQDVVNRIRSWAERRHFGAVIWTDLPPSIRGNFNVEAGLRYIQSLDTEARIEALQYVFAAPDSINTPFRQRVIEECGLKQK